MLSKRYKSTKSNVELGYMCPRGNCGPKAVTLTKCWRWCVHARYIKVLSVTVSTFKRRMENKLGERREKWDAMHRLVVTGSFWDCFTVTACLCFCTIWKEGVWWSSPGEILVEYVQNCDILDQLGRKTLPTGQFLFLTFGYRSCIEIITNYFEN